MAEDYTDDGRFPLLTREGREFLSGLREHKASPQFTERSGNRLTAEWLEYVREFASRCGVMTGGEEERCKFIGEGGEFAKGDVPRWVKEYYQKALGLVPYYKRYRSFPERWEDVPTISRSELSADPYSFVPDDVKADELIKYTTTGTTGHPIIVPSHPKVAGCYIPLLLKALKWHGVSLELGADSVGDQSVACVLVGYQQKCFTYPSVTPLLGNAGFVKLNLFEGDWRHPTDREEYIEFLAPAIFTGDPLSFSVLSELPFRHRPRALISSSMALLPGLRRRLEIRFKCPVIDLYALNEVGPVAASLPGGGYGLLQPQVHLEVLNETGQSVQPGEWGEITVTGGINFCMPLIRYRTGDTGVLEEGKPGENVGDTFRKGGVVLREFQGRPPVWFRTASGRLINNIEVTHALEDLALSQYSLYQARDGSLTMRVLKPFAEEAEVRERLEGLFGSEISLALDVRSQMLGKIVQYVSEMETGVVSDNS